MDPSRQRRVRLAFLAILAGAAVQPAILRQVGEPYPALIMPGFPGSDSGSSGAGVAVESFEAAFISDRATIAVTPRELLAEFPDSTHGVLGGLLIDPIEEPPTRDPASLREQIRRAFYRVFPGFAAARDRRNTPEHQASLAAWLRRRAAVLAPGRNISRVELRRFTDLYHQEGDRLVSQRTPGPTIVIPLPETADAR